MGASVETPSMGASVETPSMGASVERFLRHALAGHTRGSRSSEKR